MGKRLKPQIDARRLKPEKIQAIIIMLLTKSSSISNIARSLEVSDTTVKRVNNFISDLDLDLNQAINMSLDDLNKIYYRTEIKDENDLSQPERIFNNRLIPNYMEEAKFVVEQKHQVKKRYIDYKLRAEELKVKVISRTSFYGKVNKCINSLKEAEPGFYIAQDFKAGNRFEIDWDGTKVSLPIENGVITCSVFIVSFPFSYYVVARFVRDQTTAETCANLGVIFKNIGKTFPLCVCDNAKSLVTYHRGQDAVINPSFDSFMKELGTCVYPSPVYRPQTKSSVEYAARLVGNVIQENINNFKIKRSLEEHNNELKKLIDRYINTQPFRGSQSSTRKYLFEECELPAANPLPKEFPEFARVIESIRVPESFLINIEGHQYSVPRSFIGEYIDVKIYLNNIKFYFANELIAEHQRQYGPGKSILEEHKPKFIKKIEAEEELYPTPQALIDHAYSLNEDLGYFCKMRLGDNPKDPNAVRCCKSAISKYKNAEMKQLFGQACRSVANTAPEYHCNTYEIEKLYKQSLKDLEKTNCSETVESVTAFIPDSNENLKLHK